MFRFAAALVMMAAAAQGFSMSPRRGVVRSALRMSTADATPLESFSSPTATSAEDIVQLKSTDDRWKKRTKQVATLGPASNSREMIETLFKAGVDVFRLNFSHGEPEEKKALVDLIREVEAQYDHPICILADLQGPKQRVGKFAEKVVLKDGQDFRFDLNTEELGDETRVSMPHPEIINTLKVDDTVLLDDGKLQMTVTGKGEGFVDCRVDIGGDLSDRKGVNTPTISIPISPLTPKDRADLEHALEFEVDWVALSFVQKAEDMAELRGLVGDKVKILAKIEKPQAVDVLDEILEYSDGIMVARGDLGVEMNPYDVPVIQKRIISMCRDAGKPVIVATQMLESMIGNPTPTRAEASDVATAVYDGADAVMLSGESAAGKYPLEAVRMQANIIARVEEDPEYLAQLHIHEVRNSARASVSLDPTNAIVDSARAVAREVQAAAIVCFSLTGTTVLMTSQRRPEVPIMAITSNARTARFLALSWGIYPVVVDQAVIDSIKLKDAVRAAARSSMDKGLAKEPNNLLVMMAGLPFGTPGVVNFLRICPAGGPDVWDCPVAGDMKNVDDTI
eukprot:CAMPEP_0118859434 /NCGR_PEP_ID=MMETSP1163-20130328/5678_1 /TAXON_ID=124430 /ORGANISM="Phaeomonas parva, Strain CCMP2877" /LENGTH=564 /DNA_ID=CAMNT_0006793025 /DNA_START=80 /DNA_END=1774 /DNA_ORIENTATION=+